MRLDKNMSRHRHSGECREQSWETVSVGRREESWAELHSTPQHLCMPELQLQISKNIFIYLKGKLTEKRERDRFHWLSPEITLAARSGPSDSQELGPSSRCPE